MSKKKNKNHPQWGSQGKTYQSNNKISKGEIHKIIIGLYRIITSNLDNTKGIYENYANRKLSSQEYDEQISRYEKRAQLRMSLFDNTDKIYSDDDKLVCGGCGCVPKKKTHIQRYGWKVEVVTVLKVSNTTVSWCPDCQKLEEYHNVCIS